MLQPVVVVVSKFHAYMQKQKPHTLGKQDIETLALRLGVTVPECDAIIRDDRMADENGLWHGARRLDVVVSGAAQLPPTEYHTPLDDSPEGRIKPEKSAKPKKRKRKTTAADLGAPTMKRKSGDDA